MVPELKAGKNIMIAAHGNSLRAIIMYLDQLTSKEVIELELSTGIPMLYTLKDSKFLRRGSPVGPTVHGVYALTEVNKAALILSIFTQPNYTSEYVSAFSEYFRVLFLRCFVCVLCRILLITGISQTPAIRPEFESKFEFYTN